MDAIVHLKDKYQIDIKFIGKPGLIFEDFKFEILETKDEDPEGETKVIDNKYGKELELMESAKVKSEVSTQKVAKSKPEEEVAKTKKRYSKRKSSQRKGQSRSRVRKSYASTRKPDSAKVSASVSRSIDPQASDKKTFHISSEVEPPIIPLPAPFVRSEPTTISGSEAEADKSGSIPD